jgi:hypothetical protein
MCLNRHAQLSLSILAVMAGAGLLTASMDTDPPTGYEEEDKCYSINVSTVCDTTVSTVATTTVPVTTSALTSSSKATTSTVSVTTTTTEVTALTTTEPVIVTTQTIVTEPEVVPEPTEPYVPEPAVADTSTDSGLPISEYERVLLCNVVANEYGSDWVSVYDKACVVATIMNRVADSQFPSTIEGVLTQPYQFSGYWCSSSYYPTVTQSCIDAVNYYFEHSSEFPYYLYFDGGHYAADGSGPYNYFR